MKKLYVTFLMVFGTLLTFGQNLFPYSFSSSTATYNNLNGATDILANVVWDDSIIAVPLGFNFKYALANRDVDSVYIDTYGMIYPTEDALSIFGMTFPTKAMMPYQVDMVDRATVLGGAAKSPVSYQTTGMPGSRICKIEFRNAGFYDDATGMDSTNFQVWLYETSNVIEYHYGPQYVQDITTSFSGENGPWINLVYESTLDIQNQSYILDECTYVAGNSAAHTAVNPTSPIDLNTPPANFAFVGLPANGQVFRWTPSVNTSVNDLDMAFASVQVYPTTFENSIFIRHENRVDQVSLYDVNGRLLIQEAVNSSLHEISTGSLASGVYLLSLKSKENMTKTYKLIK